MGMVVVVVVRSYALAKYYLLSGGFVRMNEPKAYVWVCRRY